MGWGATSEQIEPEALLMLRTYFMGAALGGLVVFAFMRPVHDVDQGKQGHECKQSEADPSSPQHGLNALLRRTGPVDADVQSARAAEVGKPGKGNEPDAAQGYSEKRTAIVMEQQPNRACDHRRDCADLKNTIHPESPTAKQGA